MLSVMLSVMLFVMLSVIWAFCLAARHGADRNKMDKILRFPATLPEQGFGPVPPEPSSGGEKYHFITRVRERTQTIN